MRESHRKGVASHPDLESCVSSRKAAIEALTEAHAGRVLSCEIIATGVPTPFSKAEGHTARSQREFHADSAQSETPGMYGHSTRENRETPPPPAVAVWPRAGQRRLSAARLTCTSVGSRTVAYYQRSA